MDGNQRTQSPRATLHIKSVEPSEHEQAAIPASHGRRIMQMIFRSNNEDENRLAPREAMVATSPVALDTDSRTEDEVPVDSSRFSTLKRKLFPSRKRRPPARIPPLVISPINADIPVELATRNYADNQESGPERLEFDPILVGRSEDSVGIDDDDDGDIDDDLLEAIEAADRLQSTTSDETLTEMNRAIEELERWKIEHNHATRVAREEMEETLGREDQTLATCADDYVAQSALLEDVERNQQMAAAARANLQLALKITGASMANGKIGDGYVSRVLLEAERQSVSDAVNQTDSQATHIRKLRGEIFDLEVKEISSTLQQSYLGDLEVADEDLDMKLGEVEAFASELDSVLAQFDAAQTSFRETEQNPAGQVAREH